MLFTLITDVPTQTILPIVSPSVIHCTDFDLYLSEDSNFLK